MAGYQKAPQALRCQWMMARQLVSSVLPQHKGRSFGSWRCPHSSSKGAFATLMASGYKKSLMFGTKGYVILAQMTQWNKWQARSSFHIFVRTIILETGPCPKQKEIKEQKNTVSSHSLSKSKSLLLLCQTGHLRMQDLSVARRPPLTFLTPASQGSMLKAVYVIGNKPFVSLSKSFQLFCVFSINDATRSCGK